MRLFLTLQSFHPPCLTTLFLSSSLLECLLFPSSFCLTAFIPPDQLTPMFSSLPDYPTFPPLHCLVTFYSYFSVYLTAVYLYPPCLTPTHISLCLTTLYSSAPHCILHSLSLLNHPPFLSHPLSYCLHSSLPFCMADLNSSLSHFLISLHFNFHCFIVPNHLFPACQLLNFIFLLVYPASFPTSPASFLTSFMLCQPSFIYFSLSDLPLLFLSFLFDLFFCPVQSPPFLHPCLLTSSSILHA